jgi:hypothetical protein
VNMDWKWYLYIILNDPKLREAEEGGSGKEEDNGEDVYI